jgi:hypothetical protein
MDSTAVALLKFPFYIKSLGSLITIVEIFKLLMRVL